MLGRGRGRDVARHRRGIGESYAQDMGKAGHMAGTVAGAWHVAGGVARRLRVEGEVEAEELEARG